MPFALPLLQQVHSTLRTPLPRGAKLKFSRHQKYLRAPSTRLFRFRAATPFSPVIPEIRLPIRGLRACLAETLRSEPTIVEKAEASGKFPWPH